MLKLFKYTLVSLIVLLAFGCRQAKYVANGNYLLKKNEILFASKDTSKRDYKSDHELIDKSAMLDLVRPQPNLKVKLFIYNRIDTTKHERQVDRKTEKYRVKNNKREAKENAINLKRIKKAKAKGKETYKHKVIPPKTIKYGWRDWVLKNMAEAPVLLDSNRVDKSDSQMKIYLKKKGFYFAEVSDSILLKEKKQKATVFYLVKPGQPYRVRNFGIDSIPDNKGFMGMYQDYLDKQGVTIRPGDLLDEDQLDLIRNNFSQFCRNEGAYFGFNKNYISFVVDTTVGPRLADVIMFIKPKFIKNPNDPSGPEMQIPHLVYRNKHVTFYLHNTDTASFKNYAAFKRRCDDLGLNEKEEGDYVLLDTLELYIGTFIFNEEPFIDPYLLDKQNFLEIDRDNPGRDNDTLKYYKEYYVERTYGAMVNLDVFSTITPTISVDPEAPRSRFVVIRYDLYPNKKQFFQFEPRAMNTNGALGISGGVSYTNKNLFRGAQKLKIGFNGGMESQPLIVGENGGGPNANRWQLNTFEWGPSISLSFPKLVPMPESVYKTLSKRLYPETVFDLKVNYQRRREFKRRLAEFSYSWDFSEGKTNEWKLSIIKFNFVKLDKEDFFIQTLADINDPFLLNSYTDHFSTLFGLDFHFNNLKANNRMKKKGNRKYHIYDFTISALESGNILYYTGVAESNIDPATGLRQLFGVPFTQFVRGNAQYIASLYLNKRSRLVFRGLAGAILAYGNSPSAPYEQSFFAGGSNDIRAFEARTMAPGSTKVYADENATQTQIGDMRLEVNAEWRFPLTSLLAGALFVDAGNIWNLPRAEGDFDDPGFFRWNRFYREIAIGTGLGIRADFDFLIVRADVSFPLHNPYMPAGERWYLSSKTAYKSYFDTDANGNLIDYERPHLARLSIGIGYPF
jgi:hypothetical protein